MKKFFTLIALALSAQASMAQDVIASFTFPNEIMATQTEQEKADAIAKTASAEGVAGTGCTVDYAKIGGYTSSGGENWKVLNGVHFQKLTHATLAFITLHLSSGKFQAGDVLKATLYNGSTSADGLRLKEATATAHNVDHTKEAASTLVYTLTANDLNEDGSLTVYRSDAKCYVNTIWVERNGEGGGGEGDDPTPDVDNALLKEYFDYTENSALEGQGGWVVSTKASEATGSSPIVISRTITYSGYDGSATGKAALFDDDQQQTTEGNSRNSVVPFVSAKPATDDVFYAAFLGDFSNTATTSGKEIFSFIKQGAAAGDGTTARGRVWVKVTEDGNKSFAIRKNGQTIETYSAETPKTDAALLVVKYVNKSTGSSGDADEFYLFVNPDPSKTEAENAAVKMDALGNDADGGADLRYVSFRQTKLNAAYAGLRVAKTWEDAVKYKSATAIEQVAAKKMAANGEFFNLAGQRVAQPTKGLYIINGKKVVVK